MIGMTRAFIADPHFAVKVARGDEVDVRPCVGAGYCVDRVISGKDALCIQNPATSREGKLPHVIAPSPGPRRHPRRDARFAASVQGPLARHRTSVHSRPATTEPLVYLPPI